jgi:hypothetical protein
MHRPNAAIASNGSRGAAAATTGRGPVPPTSAQTASSSAALSAVLSASVTVVGHVEGVLHPTRRRAVATPNAATVIHRTVPILSSSG